MKDKKTLLVAVLLLLSVGAHAQKYPTDAEVALVAANYINCHLNPEKHITKDNVTTHKKEIRNGRVLLHEVHFDSIQILLSGVMSCDPVVMYRTSTEDSFLLDEPDECGVRYFINRYCDEISYAIDSSKKKNLIKPEWNALMNGAKDPAARDTIGPKLSSKWTQSWSNDSNGWIEKNAYNHYVPYTDNGDTCKAGCVAVAAAQIMYYWKYPVHTFSLGPSRQIDWCNMVDSLSVRVDANYEVHRNAIAKLIREFGRASMMSYCISNTSSFDFPSWAKNAFVNHYGYCDKAEVLLRRDCGDRWTDTIKHELKKMRPVFYAGAPDYNISQSHAFICYRYTSNGDMYCFNFGWYGNNSAIWAKIVNVHGSGGLEYNTLERIIVNLYPNPNNQQDSCDYTMYLYDRYRIYYRKNLWNTPQPYHNVPNVAAHLVSCSESDFGDRIDTFHLHENPSIVVNYEEEFPIMLTPNEYPYSCPTSMIMSGRDTFYVNTGDSILVVHQDTILVCHTSTVNQSWMKIPAATDATYSAHKDILLRPGFHAEAGCEFRAYIEPCERCENEVQTQQAPPIGGQPEEQWEETMLAPADSRLWTFTDRGETSPIRLYPNPTSGELTIEEYEGEVQIIDLHGRVVHTFTHRSPLTTHHLQLPSGTYLVRFVNSGDATEAVRKLIFQ